MSTNTEERTIGTETDEPVNTTDVAEGGILGALGGGIIGALAGGPVGAVIGAILGGGASAVAVDIVDHHDGDSTPASNAPESTFFADNFQTKTNSDEIDEVPVIIIDRTYIIEDAPSISEFSDDVDDETIRYRAYELWEQRGHAIGLADRDWLDAEDELTGATAVAA